MSFQFVHATPDDIEYSAETRRRIRSQAMRDYRRRQRAEGSDFESSPEPSPPSSSASPPVPSRIQSRAELRRRQSSSQSLSVQSVNLRKHSSGTSSDNAKPPQSVDPTVGDKRPSPQTTLESGPASTSQRRRRRQRRKEAPHAQHGVFSQFMINLPKRRTPPTIEEDIDLLSSLDQLEQLLDACEDYSTWLHASIPAESASKAKPSGQSDEKTSQMLLCALSLKSMGHLEIVRPLKNRVNKNVLKTKVLALLNKRLKDPGKALEDSTIGALACLASYEMSQGSTEATMHLTGLSQIVALRGSTAKIGETAGLKMFLEILDLTHAVYFDTAPLYTVVDRSQPSSTEETPGPPAELDQAMLDDISNFILSIPALAETGEQVPEVGQVLFGVETVRFEEEVERWDSVLRHAAREMEDEGMGTVCRLAADLHLLSTSAVQPHPTRMRQQVEELDQALARVADEDWDDHPSLHTQILLTAISTAAMYGTKSLRHAHLTRRLYQSTADTWLATKALVLRFIEMRTEARSRRDIWGVRALAGGVDMEIVVESVGEAEGRGMTVLGGGCGM